MTTFHQAHSLCWFDFLYEPFACGEYNFVTRSCPPHCCTRLVVCMHYAPPNALVLLRLGSLSHDSVPNQITEVLSSLGQH